MPRHHARRRQDPPGAPASRSSTGRSPRPAPARSSSASRPPPSAAPTSTSTTGPPTLRLGVESPQPFGHEFAGEVVAVGAGVDPSRVGQLVAGETHYACFECALCKADQLHICQNMLIFGVHTPGAFAEYTSLPDYLARPLPASFTPDVGALLEVARRRRPRRLRGPGHRPRCGRLRLRPDRLLCRQHPARRGRRHASSPATSAHARLDLRPRLRRHRHHRRHPAGPGRRRHPRRRRRPRRRGCPRDHRRPVGHQPGAQGHPQSRPGHLRRPAEPADHDRGLQQRHHLQRAAARPASPAARCPAPGIAPSA